jgi:malonate-semialdehyde dehydrogenase (acetylating)/methylmalonate-semialdehyde dehydrogenase
MKLVDLPAQAITCKNLVGGQWLAGAGGAGDRQRMLDVRSPYTGGVIGHVPLSTPAEVDDAVRKAHAAFPAWRRTPIKERAQPLFRFRELTLARLDEIANLAAAEAGKTVAEARAGVLKGLEVVEFALSLQNLDYGGALEVSRGVTCQAQREPLGVVVGIAPFNFPAMVPLWMIPIAIALGNCFILKPSEKVPLTAQLMGELMQKAGLPDGVFSIVNGARETVEALIDHELTQAVGFVGSTAAAKAVYQRAAARGKRALALGGAKNHLLVVPDADEALTVRGVVDSFTGCAGQRCMAASLLVAVGDVDRIIDKVKATAAALAPGAGLGAIIDGPALERIEGIIGRAAKDGAEVVVDGRGRTPPKGYDGGTWLAPTVIDHARPDMECAQTEIFGPVLTIVRVKTLAEAMALEATSGYGNATSVFTSSGAVARYVAETATNGMIGVNIGVPVPREPFSFGGTKASKFGHGDITGEPSLDFWSNLKKITTKWAPQADANWMS